MTRQLQVGQTIGRDNKETAKDGMKKKTKTTDSHDERLVRISAVTLACRLMPVSSQPAAV